MSICWFWLLFGIVLWLILLRFPDEDGVADLDFSWRLCLAHFCKHRARAGVDYIWTYGPLGYFTTTAYDPDLFWLKYLWEIALRRYPGRFIRRVSARCCLLFAVIADRLWLRSPRGGGERCRIRYILGGHCAGRGGCRWPPSEFGAEVVAAASAFLAIIAMCKFTFLYARRCGMVGAHRGGTGRASKRPTS